MTVLGEPDETQGGAGMPVFVLATTLPSPPGSTKAIVIGCLGELEHQLLQITLE